MAFMVSSKFQNVFSGVLQQRGAHNSADITSELLNPYDIGGDQFAVKSLRHLSCPLAEIGRAIHDSVVMQSKLPVALMHRRHSLLARLHRS